ncbi:MULTISPECIES: UDP-N-acetylmuramoyl-L-alanyl-D-glutamate--2,6-diaminopimelate ligase [unclassified Prosthecochloris]|uniref:UDP-N-acetylmuramoyl-L-alanyl-D-glutamate--2, 6-diaminopimelate ligase n=1 Tax=unclassified Prosthecochloris TaxID=2632826 RepID=UPI00223E7E11|nr:MULTISPECIES: UDP-N-acetylmuramoyl-L-alanyl-D-glutamate--2,6-diaminopimelate ligase [unclassified Prosthecochloris]UZJ37609.1 UDP-N-acetylmuramoyl-L-alanyl-D-glutamate--2,6-diaminopimelate ligase [Prosthecochloris sp. SCSIO W1103]UZJ39428.1 UDP-N-acetylmuramoyl-L-alanyl-D-glutamate--2,6-diaminopimelate ligase [Prosthecochloris sp. SCSIO W1102]
MERIKLYMLLERLEVLTVTGGCESEMEIQQITSDSREIVKGGLFIAVRGFETDGHRFIEDAVGKGAVIVVCQELPGTIHEAVCYVVVRDSRRSMAQLAKRFYQDVADTLHIIGVTGTNGKTTTARLMAAMMNDCGIRTGYIGTGLALVGEETVLLGKTTPEAEVLHRLFSMMAERGCKAVVMEVSSHALVLQRTHGIGFTGAVFTNLTQDHLDFHHTMERYAEAKQLLMDAVDPEGFVVVNADDPWAAFMVKKRGNADLYCCTVGHKQFACREGMDIRARIIKAEMQRTEVEIEAGGRKYECGFRLPGLYNVMNLLEVFAAGIAMGLQPEPVIDCLATASPVEGRMEIISGATGEFSAVVDYAHTPDALVKVIETLNELKPPDGALIVVFGCGGNRDRDKRPKMGSAAAKGADRVIITSDNPRDEDPDDIMDDIAEGVSSASFHRFGSRAEAIRCGVNLMKKGDILLVAGKGHENYQEVAGVRRHFSDRETITAALVARNA